MDLATGRLVIPVTYEDGDQSLVTDEEEHDLILSQWHTKFDYHPYSPNLVLDLNHFSPLLLHCYWGNYSSFMNLIEAMSPEELGRELEKRETLMNVSPVFHPIYGAKYLNHDPVDPNIVEVYGKPEKQHIKIFSKLLDLGVNMNAHDFAGLTPLHYCLSDKFMNPATFEMGKMLIKMGADVNAVNRAGNPPLTEVIMGGRLECVALLVENGADIYMTDHDGYSPYLVAQHYPEVRNMLLKAGAAFKKKQESGEKERDCSVCKKACSLKCTGCSLEWYCSALCQKTHWNNHKQLCKERKGKFEKVKLLDPIKTLGAEVNSVHCVVKVQMPRDGANNVLEVFNRDRSIHGRLGTKTPFGAKLSSTIKTEGEKGYFLARAAKKKGETKASFFMNPSILPPESW